MSSSIVNLLNHQRRNDVKQYSECTECTQNKHKLLQQMYYLLYSPSEMTKYITTMQ